MSTIIDYVNELEKQRHKLVSILNTLNVQSDDTETFNELIPKILQIYGITYFIHCKDKFGPITVDKASDVVMTPFSDRVDASAQATTQQGIVEGFAPITIETSDVIFDSFGETISDGDTIFAPTSVEQIGCGSYGLQSTDNVIGTYNSSESYYNSSEKTMKYVYDFATNQANGTIKSVCLTSQKGGVSVYGNPTNPSTVYAPYKITDDYFDFTISSDSYGTLCFMDYDSNIAYYCKVNSLTEATIYERVLPFKSISLFNDRFSTRAKRSTSYTIDISNATKTVSLYDKKQHSIYIFGHSSASISSGSQIKVSKINLTTGTVENFTLTNDSGVTITIGTNYMYMYDGCLYFYYSKTPIYMIDTTGVKDTKKLGDHWDNRYEYGLFYEIGGRIYFCKGDSVNGSGRAMVYNPELNTLYRSGITYFDNGLCIDFKGGHDLYFYFNSSYSNFRGFC